ncbi:MAG: hypothetical protein Q9160_007130 [Pyrenula sp. 1 TL-2023]
MYESHRSHPLLAQVPLTVSPFISLPTAVTLPYTYKAVQSSLPPSITADTIGTEKPKYVVSSSGHAAKPDEILASCNALQEHIKNARLESQNKITEWEAGIRDRELAEKRRVAPGWLDREEKILEPTKADGPHEQEPDLMGSITDGSAGQMTTSALSPTREGEELDRAFGGLALR